MRAVVQRVSWAEVSVENDVVGRIGQGLLIYVGVAADDGPAEAQRLAEKVAHLRIFADGEGKLNLSAQDVGGAVLVVPNFTLLADTRKGRRPAFAAAATGDKAAPLTDAFIAALRQAGCAVERGVFGAHMYIRSQADGPVNVLVEMPPA